MGEFNWNDLKSFLAVARTGKLTSAARSLGADHATVSRRLVSLEEAMHVRLFERHPTGYTLTAQGERLLPLAESMESMALTAYAELANSNLSVSGAVRIGSPDGFGSYFLAPRIGDLCRQHPALEVQLIAMPRIFSLSKREADIAIGLARPQEGRLSARKLTDYHLKLYASRSYLESGARDPGCGRSGEAQVRRLHRRPALRAGAGLPQRRRHHRSAVEKHQPDSPAQGDRRGGRACASSPASSPRRNRNLSPFCRTT